MKIRMIQSATINGVVLCVNNIAVVDDRDAKRLVDAGIAVPVLAGEPPQAIETMMRCFPDCETR